MDDEQGRSPETCCKTDSVFDTYSTHTRPCSPCPYPKCRCSPWSCCRSRSQRSAPHSPMYEHVRSWCCPLNHVPVTSMPHSRRWTASVVPSRRIRSRSASRRMPLPSVLTPSWDPPVKVVHGCSLPYSELFMRASCPSFLSIARITVCTTPYLLALVHRSFGASRISRPLSVSCGKTSHHKHCALMFRRMVATRSELGKFRERNPTESKKRSTEDLRGQTDRSAASALVAVQAPCNTMTPVALVMQLSTKASASVAAINGALVPRLDGIQGQMGMLAGQVQSLKTKFVQLGVQEQHHDQRMSEVGTTAERHHSWEKLKI